MKVLVNGLTSKFGGVESLFLNILKNNATDVSFDFICLDEVAANEEEFKSLGANVYHVTRFKENRNKYKSELEEIFSKGYDVYHLNLTRYYVPEDIILAKKHGCKVILHSHASHIYLSDNWKINLLRRVEFKVFKNYCIAHSDKRIACSENAGKYLFGKSSFDIIYNGIDYEKYIFNSVNRLEIRKEFRIENEDFLIGHVGRFQDEKNQSFIIQLINKLSKVDKKYKCILVGEGPLFGQIREMINSFNLENQVFLAGKRDDVNKIYSAMDVFILPSKHEALPLCLIEAQLNGLPCIKSNNITDEIDLVPIKKIGIQNVDLDIWRDYILYGNNLQRSENKVMNKKFNIDSFITSLIDLYHEVKR